MKKHRIGIMGSGFMSKGLVLALSNCDDVEVTKVLTRGLLPRPDFPDQGLLTTSITNFMKNSDLIVECSGDVVHAINVIAYIANEQTPVVTMNPALHLLVGKYFSDDIIITEAEGDQPGCLAALDREVKTMGFRPIVYGNMKGYLNHNPTLKDMKKWSSRSGISLQRTVEFTDGTKLQCEMALVANGLGATIVTEGLSGLHANKDEADDSPQCFFESYDFERAAWFLYNEWWKGGQSQPISDYTLKCNTGPGIFILATHVQEQRPYLRYLKMGNEPYYTLQRPYHLCHLEVIKTIREVLKDGTVLLDNSDNPSVSVAAVAKHVLEPGNIIETPIGGFDVRGIAVKMEDNPNHVPISLLGNAILTKKIYPGQKITFDDIEPFSSMALDIWRENNAKA